jgi:hypothetical protein
MPETQLKPEAQSSQLAQIQSEEQHPCEHFNKVYKDCFTQWYQTHFLKGNIVPACRQEFEDYKDCMMVKTAQAAPLDTFCCIVHFWLPTDRDYFSNSKKTCLAGIKDQTIQVVKLQQSLMGGRECRECW